MAVICKFVTMNIFIKITLFLFISFLATPTIISLLHKDVDVSYFYNISEEEENTIIFNELKVVHNEPYIFSDFFCTSLHYTPFFVYNESLKGTFLASILLPPPELL